MSGGGSSLGETSTISSGGSSTPVVSESVAHDIIPIKTQYSEPISFNILHSPGCTLKGVYNYYTEHETNQEYNETAEPMNPTKAPMYVMISWAPIKLLPEVTTKTGFPKKFHGVPVKGLDDIDLSEIETINREIDSPVVIIKH